mmetsp:Transcript_11855/g.28092  ORF Transcript_11855/g.28092 Transcript_11855/m.28092 type:complete len:303 (-) Transcript_11855:1702-2610(-)
MRSNQYTMTEAIEKTLRKRCPGSTEAECSRFVETAATEHKNVKQKIERESLILKTASEKLREYLDWRAFHRLDEDRPERDADDKIVWDWAVRKAFGAGEKKTGNSISNSSTKSGRNPSQEKSVEKPIRTLPQLIFKRRDPETGDFVRDKNGTELIQVLPARIDRFAADNETWALAVVLYIDACVDRNSSYKASIIVDARAGLGWPNPLLVMVISLIGQIVTEIDKRHPGRCQSLIIFPLPRALMFVWMSVKKLFSPEINELLVVCSGASDIDSPLPRKKLEEHVGGKTLDYLEQSRVQLFVE